jgi:starch-binding outer membrane protein, SusD/RagB family
MKYSYNDPSLRWWTGSAAWPVYRYADVLLMYLEASNEQGAASQALLDETINKTRARGGLTPLSAGLGQSGIREAIKNERLIEFMFEAKRFYDLVRWGDLVNAVNSRNFGYTGARVIDDQFKLLPIPQREMDANPNMGGNNPPWN